jgi:apolipoprotein N-acyltransferase
MAETNRLLAADAAAAVPTIGARARRLAPPVLGGVLISAAFLDFSLFPLAWAAFVPLLWSFSRARDRREAAWLGLAAGVATNVPAFYWLVYTMHVFGGFPYALSAFFYLCLSLFAALQLVLFAIAFRRLGFGPLGLAAPVLWVALEFLYPNLFPWRLANSQFHVPLLTQIGDVTGPFGLSFAMVWFGAALVLAARRPRRWRPLVASTAAVVALVAYGALRWPTVEAAVAAAPSLRVGLVQGNIGIREKGNVAFFDINVERYRKLSQSLEDRVDLIVWPESVAQWWVPAGATRLAARDNPFPGTRAYLIFGGLAFSYGDDELPEKYNSAFLIDGAGDVLGRYDKRVLLPFGEYLPGAKLVPGLAELSPETGDFTPGRRLVTLDVPGRAKVAPLICYEDVPAGIARAMTLNGAEVLMTIFNDAWFGRSMAPYQHEALALWRAIENRRYFVRVGNAGVTGVVDPFGRIVDHLGLFTEETLVEDIRPLRIETFYTRFGDVFGWSVVAAAALWLLGSRRYRGEPAP